MLYRESNALDSASHEERHRDITLKQSGALGLWVVLSLGICAIGFLGCLVSVNRFAPSEPYRLSFTPRTPWREVSTGVGYVPDAETPVSLLRSGASVTTTIPPSRAANALLGGQGPALLSGSGRVVPRGTTETSDAVVVAR